jgi:hypothetical protein
MMKMISMISNKPKVKRKKPSTQGHHVKLQKGKGKVLKIPIVERVSNAKTTQQTSAKSITRHHKARNT